MKAAQDSPAEMPVIDHLAELRRRLIWSLLALVLGTIAAYFFSSQIFSVLTKQYFSAFPRDSLIGTGPAEIFVLKLKIAALAGALIVSPFIFYQLWRFVCPGLKPGERTWALPFVLVSSFLFLTGAAFAYFLVFPYSFEFFRDEYTSVGITPNIRISEQLSFTIWLLLIFGVVFELPVLAFFLAKLDLINAPMLIAGNRWAIVIIFVVAGVVTPPDVLSQFLLAVPLLLLYGLSILIVRWVQRKRTEPPAGPASLAG